eukprot:TRINITY_DN570_c0_g1_i2.p1 TRINITY_DN570_c0_g1~~TRINITY_DN570_c0_g1_i2.p1  ORF type:complete len:540 (-),score=66.50 TRINITY_DN570_c0_g1_i2:198-1817(-)
MLCVRYRIEDRRMCVTLACHFSLLLLLDLYSARATSSAALSVSLGRNPLNSLGSDVTALLQPSRMRPKSRMAEGTHARRHDAALQSTLITGYLPVDANYSNHNHGTYREWLRNTLSLKDNMIIFIHPSMVDLARSLRRRAAGRTLVVPLAVKDTVMATKYSAAFWQKQHDKLDPRRHWIDRAIRLFWVYNEKANMIKRAIEMNPFGSVFFAWVDIGYFRTERFNGKRMIKRIPETLGQNQVLVMQSPFYPYWNVDDGGFAGGFIGGYYPGMQRYADAYYKTIDKHLDEFVGDDQPNMARTCETYSCLCQVVISKEGYGDRDPWFFMTPYMRGEAGEVEYRKMPDTCKRQPPTLRTLLIVAHAGDESLWGAEVLGENTHVIVVSGSDKSSSGSQRRAALTRAMNLTSTTWEMWDSRIFAHHGAGSERAREKLTERLQRVLSTLQGPTRVITHGKHGEHGPDGTSLHRCVVAALLKMKARSRPALEVFSPMLTNMRQRHYRPCRGSEARKAALDVYRDFDMLEDHDEYTKRCVGFKLVPLI